MTAFKTIGIFSREDGDRVQATLDTLLPYLNARGLRILAAAAPAAMLGLPPMPVDTLAQQIDVALVVGGDGTLLTAGRLLAPYQVPLIGINLGRVGFLVDVLPDDMLHQLDLMLKGDFIDEQRCLLEASVWRGKEKIGENIALNDVVLHARNEVRMIEFTTFIDGYFVNTQRADGIVISTPTGSTAYALSSGGPVLHPSLEATVLVPISPHTLSNRPIVVNNRSIISIEIGGSRPVDSVVSFDGHYNIDLISGDRVEIQGRPQKMRLLHPPDYDYYHILRTKLHWGKQP